MTRHVAKLLGLGLATFASPLASLLAVPVLIAAHGGDQWASIAVGQAIGSLATLLVAVGWNVTGSVIVARASRAEQVRIARQSIASRLIAGPAVVTGAALLAGQLNLDAPLAASLSAATVGLAGLDMAWFFIGQGRVARLLILDSLPKLLGTVTGIAMVMGGGTIEIFAVAQLSGVLVAVLVSAMISTRGGTINLPPAPTGFRGAFGALGSQRDAMFIAIASATYLSMPTLLVALLMPSATALFAISERISRAFGLVAAPFVQWLQGVSASPDDAHETFGRIRTLSIISSGCYGVLVGVLTPHAISILSAGTLEVDWLLSSAVGVAVGAGCVSRCVGGVILQHLGRIRPLLISAVAGALSTIALTALGIYVDGARGAVLAVAVAELSVMGIQLHAASRAIRELAH